MTPHTAGNVYSTVAMTTRKHDPTTSDEMITSTESSSVTTVPASSTRKDSLQSKDDKTVSMDEDRLMEAIADLDEEERSRLGYSISDLILDCRYSGYTVPLR